MKYLLNAMLVAVLLTTVVGAEEPVEVQAPVAIEDGVGMTQGQFLLRVVHAAGVERLFDGTVTATVAASRLANLGLAPEGGWRVEGDLTREMLVQAYNRLVATMAGPSDEEDGAEAAVGTASDDLTVEALIAMIIEAVEASMVYISAERQPVSPSRPIWR